MLKDFQMVNQQWLVFIMIEFNFYLKIYKEVGIWFISFRKGYSESLSIFIKRITIGKIQSIKRKIRIWHAFKTGKLPIYIKLKEK